LDTSYLLAYYAAQNTVTKKTPDQLLHFDVAHPDRSGWLTFLHVGPAS
jgi:hypothetical protein